MRGGDAGRLLRNVALVIGLAGVLALGAVALFGPELTAGDPQAQRVVIFYPDGTFKVPPTPPDLYYPLGTDPLGRDQLARVLWGARLTFTVVLLALLLRALLAVAVGVIAGWRGGAVDAAAMLGTNAIAGVPQLLLALLIAIALRERAILGFVLALGCVGWAEGAQFVRGEVIRIRRAPYIEAATALGMRTRGIIARHLLRSLAPQLFGLTALEAGATLLLLAELGFLGVFLSGAVFYVDDAGRPILPVRDRAPEWGQMLAGAQQYAFSNQYVALVPGVVVAAAVFAFNLLGEGARAATDPFSSLSLSPRALGALGRGLAALVLVSAAVFGVSAARSTELGFDDALRLAREAAERVEPGDVLIAAVVRFGSESHALARPQKYNFYFRDRVFSTILRVGFPDADQNAMEVKRYDDEDGLTYDLMRPLADWTVPWTRALEIGEDRGGRFYRTARSWAVRIVLSSPTSVPSPVYRVMYSGPASTGAVSIDVLVDARSGASDTRDLRLAEGIVRAEGALGGPVAQSQASAFWRASGNASFPGFDTDRPTGLTYGFVRADLPADRRVASVGYGGFAQAGQSTSVGVAQSRPATFAAPVDIEAAFAAIEDAGGRALREQWARDGAADWSASANATIQNGIGVVRVLYSTPRQSAEFRLDVATGRIERA